MAKNYFPLIRIFILFFACFSPLFLQAQNAKAQNSMFAGNFNISIGLGSNFYSKSNLKFSGSGYDFSLDDVALWQNSPAFSMPDFSKLLSNQYAISVGYNIRRGVNLSLGIDRLKYGIKPGQSVFLNGYVNSEMDTVSNLSGQYTDELINLDSARIQFGSNVGMSYVSIELNLMQNLYRTKRRNFVVNAIYGIGAGVLHTNSTFNFGGFQESKSSLSGFGVNANAGLRFEFFKYFYLQPNLSANFLNQVSVRTHQNASKNIGSHFFSAFNSSISAGIIIYIKSKKDCDCPVWN
jgi:hypothetical protein